MKTKYLILGGGIAALGVALYMKRNGENDFLVLEREKDAGGLCRSTYIDGTPVDFGGGHILDANNPEICRIAFEYLPENEWNIFTRDSRIVTHGKTIDYPYEANIWQLPKELQADYLESIAKAGCVRGEPMPEKFVDWIYWKLGDKIAENYMIPYNTKMWRRDLNELGTYWLYKLPDVSFREVLESCLFRSAEGRMPCHSRFYYPKKFGYGEWISRMAEDLKDNIVYGEPVKSIDFDKLCVNGKYTAEKIINTIPWTEFASSLPETLHSSVERLQFTSIDIDYYPQDTDSEAHWTYFADPKLQYHRIMHQHNYSFDTQTGFKSKGYWTETNSVGSVEQSKYYHYRNQYAYPVSLLGKPEAIKTVREWAEKKNVFSVGRWGEWEHMNSDTAMKKGMTLADKLMNK